MHDPVRWFRTQFAVADGAQILWVSAVDVLKALEDDRADDLHDALAMLLLTDDPVPDVIPDDL